MNRGIGSYRKIDTLGKSQVDLLLMVYGGATQALLEAEKAFETENRELGREKLKRAKKFVTHLYTTLDNEKGGEVAERLGQLYVFIIEQIKVAEATGKTEIIADMRVVLDNLRKGWQGLKVDAADQDVSSAPSKEKASRAKQAPKMSELTDEAAKRHEI